MNHTELLQEAIAFMQIELRDLCSAHDFYHIDRVLKLSEHIQSQTGGDRIRVQLGAVFHEFLDEKFFTPEQLEEKRQAIIGFLSRSQCDPILIHDVVYIVSNVGFGKSLERGDDFHLPLELAIVEDADRLESIGAIAIARTFAYGGKRNRTIYDPSEEQGSQVFTRESYYAMQRSSIAHFYDKLLLLKDLLHTQPAQIIAQERHEFMKVYLKQFYREWNLEGLS